MRRSAAVKVLIGSMNEDQGTVEMSQAGLVYVGPDPEHLRGIVEGQREWYDRAGVLHVLTDEEVVCSLPYRLQGHLIWAVFVDEKTGLTVDQPEYDPWGDIWRSARGE
jgi:hypothetical protein